jgi:hypothetical protein
LFQVTLMKQFIAAFAPHSAAGSRIGGGGDPA